MTENGKGNRWAWVHPVMLGTVVAGLLSAIGLMVMALVDMERVSGDLHARMDLYDRNIIPTIRAVRERTRAAEIALVRQAALIEWLEARVKQLEERAK